MCVLLALSLAQHVVRHISGSQRGGSAHAGRASVQVVWPAVLQHDQATVRPVRAWGEGGTGGWGEEDWVWLGSGASSAFFYQILNPASGWAAEARRAQLRGGHGFPWGKAMNDETMAAAAARLG